MYLEPQDFTNTPSPSMTFYVSYCQRTTELDKLAVEVSVNCGVSWSPKYIKTGTTLATTVDHTSTFTPSTTAEWRQETINLNTLGGMNDIWVRFKATSNQGNNIYVDNINISPSAIEENANVASLNIFPNPANENTTVNFGLKDATDVSITLTNSIGQVLSTESLGNTVAGDHYYDLNTSELSNGIYFITITTSEGSVSHRIAVSH
jgi:hypothetical protein